MPGLSHMVFRMSTGSSDENHVYLNTPKLLGTSEYRCILIPIPDVLAGRRRCAVEFMAARGSKYIQTESSTDTACFGGSPNGTPPSLRTNALRATCRTPRQ